METDTLGMIGTSERIQEVRRIIMNIADTDVAVLIQGESGTGKELAARAIHVNSGRASGEMVSVNCGAIPEGILESELFGHERGAFTGAVSRRAGYFEVADKGTIFLDEIGEMSLHTQVKLLRVLESGEFLRVGGSRKMTSDARVIAATNKDLEEEVRKGNFREDLYYRLKTVTVTLPPLRERRDDIDLLVKTFIVELEKKYKIRHRGFSPEVTACFHAYSWPGNIRELKNLLESLFLLKKGGLVELSDLPENIRESSAGVSGLPVRVNKSSDQAERELIYRALLSMRDDISDLKNMLFDTMNLVRKNTGSGMYERSYSDVSEFVDVSSRENFDDLSVGKIEGDAIRKALRRFNGNRRLAAHALGISERTLYRKLKKLR